MFENEKIISQIVRVSKLCDQNDDRMSVVSTVVSGNPLAHFPTVDCFSTYNVETGTF